MLYLSTEYMSFTPKRKRRHLDHIAATGWKYCQNDKTPASVFS